MEWGPNAPSIKSSEVVNFFTVISTVCGKLIRHHTGKQSKCHVVKKFIDIHSEPQSEWRLGFSTPW